MNPLQPDPVDTGGGKGAESQKFSEYFSTACFSGQIKLAQL